MYSDFQNYPIWCTEKEFDCLPNMATIFVFASKKHFGIFIPLKKLPQISEIQSPNNPHGCIFENTVEDFYELTAEYLAEAEERNFSLPFPEQEMIGREFFGEFVELSGKIPVFNDASTDVEYLDMNGKYLFIAESGTTLEEFLSDNNETSTGHTIN